MKQLKNSRLKRDTEKEIQTETILTYPDPDCEFEIIEKIIRPENLICPFCGGKTPVGLDFCVVCGADLPTEADTAAKK